MEMYGYEFTREEDLKHHGILGQKWGKRNGPPYPLDAGDHSAAEKKAGWRKSLKKVDKKHSTSYTKDEKSADDDFEQHQKWLEKVNRENPNAAVIPPANSWFKEHRKGILIGAGVATAAVGAVWLWRSGALSAPSPSTAFNGFNSNEEKFMRGWFKANLVDKNRHLTEAAYRALSNDGVELDAGSPMYRMSKGSHSTLRDGIEYVSINEEDRQRYKGFLPQMWRAKGSSPRSTKEYFEAELSAKVKIKAPGEKETVDIMADALRRIYPHYTPDRAHKEALQHFYEYEGQIGHRSSPLAKSFYRELTKRGYNATIDFNDAGNLSEKPVILVNGRASATVNKVNTYSRQECRTAFRSIKPVTSYDSFSKQDWDSMAEWKTPNGKNTKALYEAEVDRWINA